MWTGSLNLAWDASWRAWAPDHGQSSTSMQTTYFLIISHFMTDFCLRQRLRRMQMSSLGSLNLAWDASWRAWAPDHGQSSTSMQTTYFLIISHFMTDFCLRQRLRRMQMSSLGSLNLAWDASWRAWAPDHGQSSTSMQTTYFLIISHFMTDFCLRQRLRRMQMSSLTKLLTIQTFCIAYVHEGN